MVRFSRVIILIFSWLAFSLLSYAQEPDLESVLKEYFSSFSLPNYRPNLKQGIDGYWKNDEEHTLMIDLNEGFASQVFTPDVVEKIYTEVSQRLPEPYKDYTVKVLGFGHEISELIPSPYRRENAEGRLWGKIKYKGAPWTLNISNPFKPTKGLQGRHICVWASHGRYFSFDKQQWIWQRPQLFCTTEDLFTQSIVTPFLIPMLENAGAVVYMPRERDWQRQEIIVDNDNNTANQYSEINGRYPWVQSPSEGFAHSLQIYPSNHNPFLDGTARMIRAVSMKTAVSTCRWSPNIPEDGLYAVYVSYPSLPESVSDAEYTVVHKGINTTILVNQQMGGNTWVYLGTFSFSKGQSDANCVILSNHSRENGVVTSDAVRFGGGMGNIARGDSINGFQVSGLPRHMEGARYYAQWSGMPDLVYDTKDGYNDYADDINVRSRSLNYLGGGSPFMPEISGQGVPFELSLAVHSDAGITHDGTVIGTLAVHTPENDSLDTHFNSGLSRTASLDFASILQLNLCHDLSESIKMPWMRRELYCRNYSETRLPEVPSAIIEMFSHQNFTDMKYGHDPNFKFLVARSLYKSILLQSSYQHQQYAIMAPLPPSHFAALIQEEGDVLLSWIPREDKINPEAIPNGYIVYTQRDGEDFDNGRYVSNATSMRISIEPDVLYNFKVCAVNDGGKSFPTETLSALRASQEKSRVLIVNGFTRLSAPEIHNTPTDQGFDIEKDEGVAYFSTPEYCGYQLEFNPTAKARRKQHGWGDSDDQLQGILMAGNTFDYPVIHARSIKACQYHSVSSCSMDALLMGLPPLKNYPYIDLILGLQKDCGESSIIAYKTFPLRLQEILHDYLHEGGSLLATGAYIASDMCSERDRHFLSTTLHCSSAPSPMADGTVKGNGFSFSYVKLFGSHQYAVTHPDALKPIGKAIPFLTYTDGKCAGVAYQNGLTKIMLLGFPFEAISTKESQNQIMNTFLNMTTN